MVRTDLFDYELPESLIAERPAAVREAARLLVLQRSGFEHRTVADLSELVPSDALVVLNQTKVRRARLLGQREVTGGRVELLLLERNDAGGSWLALGKANRPLVRGDVVQVGELALSVLEKHPDGTLSVQFESSEIDEEALAKVGRLPLPPYIRRASDAADDERYQTVFAKELGSVAAPTAGLHLSARMLGELESRGVELGFLSLHVGLGTFRPVSADDLDDHVMHAEHIDVSERLVSQVRRAKQTGRPVVAVGTTVVRALESAATSPESGWLERTQGRTRLFIQPGYRFRLVDCLLTNFHMPKSTLLALVAAFAGHDRLFAGYRAAIDQKYRFLSYGDAMWIPRCYGREP